MKAFQDGEGIPYGADGCPASHFRNSPTGSQSYRDPLSIPCKHKRRSGHCWRKTLDPNDYEKKALILDIHPSERKGILFDPNEPMGDALEICTDGSCLGGGVGTTMVVLYHGQLVYSEERLLDAGTVFQAELIGIKIALDFCESQRDGSLIHIYSDLKSALQSLADPRNTHKIVKDIKGSIELRTETRKLHCCIGSRLTWVIQERS
ncbi:hypothetical protein AVEN_193171-1 [Araneus ventricosus]|uniref:Uncharacterized protein n=1 Tax=Araneus ventricosus TaxID=182803 RepID=A0A4Y2B056_ARAVE|nr:hypothetical protein AVEN_193171-1 [Araneus ventricosus]